jgi:transcriptional regulator with XRE-family HTH domain
MRDEEKTATGVEDEEDLDLAPHNVVDKVAFGRRLRALRIIHGFDRVTDFVSLLRSRYGIDVSDRTVYAIERGEQMPHLDFFVACLALLDPERGYFFPAIRGDVVESLKKAEHI